MYIYGNRNTTMSRLHQTCTTGADIRRKQNDSLIEIHLQQM